MNDDGKPQNDKAQQNEQAHELIEQLNLLEAIDRRITPEHVAKRFRALLDDIGDDEPPRPEIDERPARILDQAGHGRELAGLWREYDADRCLEPVDLIGSMEAAAIATARGAAADIVADAQLKAKASADELRITLQATAAARRQAQEAIKADRQEAEKIIAATRDDALKRAAEMIRDAKDQAEQILGEARSAAGQIITVGTHLQEAPPFEVEGGDFANPVKPTWKQATALVSLSTCGAMTGFAFGHGTVDDIPEKNPVVTGNHLEEKDAARDWIRLEQRAVLGRAVRGRRVFISHTSELLDFSKERSDVAAVEQAISAAGPVIVDTADFPAAGLAIAQLYAKQVRGCDVYLWILGHRYGSPAWDKPEVSYTELEFGTATGWSRGRQVEMGLLAEYLTGSGTAMVTVTGHGGIGKTALMRGVLKGLEVGRNPDKEQVQLARALARPIGLANVHWAPAATWMDGAWHVLHFSGHGDFVSGRDERMLVQTREDGHADLVAAHRAALLRQGRAMPRLVVLNSCSGAAAWASDLLSDTAAVLVHEDLADARQQAEQVIADAHREADEALKQAAEMVRVAREQAERIISDARLTVDKYLQWLGRFHLAPP